MWLVEAWWAGEEIELKKEAIDFHYFHNFYKEKEYIKKRQERQKRKHEKENANIDENNNVHLF